MQLNDSLIVLAVSVSLIWSISKAEQRKPDFLYTSPSGAMRVERTVDSPSTGEDPTVSTWVVVAKDPTQRAKLPKRSADSPDDDEFHCPLPIETELKTQPDQPLNTNYSEFIAKSRKDRNPFLREGERGWIKARDQGATFVSHFFRKRSGSNAVFSLWVTSTPRGSNS
ncbi:MAG TPA: hypothetical protein VFO40_12320 [Chthoniobacterales bacterium]|nr:hypothetical protein [Chthoniobacterales bacterium]